MKNINIEEVKRYLKRSLKKKVKITTSLIVLFMMSNSIISMAEWLAIDKGIVGEKGVNKTGYKRGVVALNPKDENADRPQKEEVEEFSVAIGLGAEAKIKDSVAIGFGAKTESVEYYNSDTLDEKLKKNNASSQSTAIGTKTVAVDQATSVGNDTYAIGRSSIAIGSDDNKQFREETTAYDFNKYFKKLYDKIGTGDGSKYGAKNGKYRQFTETDFSYNYSPTLAASDGGIAIGTRALSYGIGATSIGAMSYALGNYSTAMGAKTRAEGKGAIAIGNSTKVFSDHSVAVGNENQILQNGGTAYGYKAYSAGKNSIAIGTEVYSNTTLVNDKKGIHSNYIENDNNTLFETTYMTRDIDQVINTRENKINEEDSLNVVKEDKNEVSNVIKGKDGSDNSVVLGTKSMATESNSIALGHGTFSLAKNSMAFGSFSYVKGNNSLGLGVDSKVFSNNSIAIGTRAGVGYNSDNSLVMGNFSYSTGENALVFGNKSKATAKNGLAIGSNSEASLENSTALGVNSKTDYNSNWLAEPGYAPKGAISSLTSTGTGVVSIGTIGKERRLTNLASGYRDTDAVNVAQLRSLEEKLSAVNQDEEDTTMLNYLSVDKKNSTGEGYKVKEIALKEAYYKEYVKLKAQDLEIEVRKTRNSEKFKDEYTGKIKKRIAELEGKNITAINNAKKDTYGKYTEGYIKNNTKTVDSILKEISDDKDKALAKNQNQILTNEEIAKLKASNYNNDGATGADAIALGYGANAKGSQAVAIGKNAKGDGEQSVVIGTPNSSNNKTDEETDSNIGEISAGVSSVSIGNGVKSKDYSVGIGGNVVAGKTAVAIGDRARAIGQESVAIGNKTKTNATQSYVFGGESEISKDAGQSSAIGYKVTVKSSQAVAMGNDVVIEENSRGAIAIGSDDSNYNEGNNKENGSNNYTKTKAKGNATTAIGAHAQATDVAATALGARAFATEKETVAVGANSKASVEGAVAIGSYSLADQQKNTTYYNPKTGNTDGQVTGKLATKAAVSIGNAKNNVTRQLIGLAAGTNDTDAVNVWQLKELKSYFDENKNFKLEGDNKAEKTFKLPNKLEIKGNTAKKADSKPEEWDDKYTVENVQTFVKQDNDGKTSVLIGLRKDPRFDKVTVGGENKTEITESGINITKKVTENNNKVDKVVKFGIDDKGNATLTDARNTTASAIVTENTLGAQKISYTANSDTNKKQTSLTNGFDFTSNDLEIKTEDNGKVTFKLSDKVKNSLNGEAGTVVYTDSEGNRLVKANDGKYYKKEFVEDNGKVKANANGQGVENPELRLVDATGKTTKPITLGNVASALGLSEDKKADKKYNKEVTEKLINKEATENSKYTEAELNKVVTLRDLQFLASKGITFAGSTGRATKFLGDTIKINKSNSMGETSFDTKYETKNIAVKVDKTTGDIEVGLAKELTKIKSITSEEDPNDKTKTKITLSKEGATFGVEKDKIEGKKTITEQVGVKTTIDKDGISVTKKGETTPSVSIKESSIEFATKEEGQDPDKKTVGTGSITGLKDLDDNSDGHKAVNKNYVDKKVKTTEDTVTGKITELEGKKLGFTGNSGPKIEKKLGEEIAIKGDDSSITTEAKDNAITIKVKDKGITENKLADDLLTKIKAGNTAATNTITLSGDNGIDNKPTKTSAEALNKNGGINFSITGEDGLKTTASGTNVKIGMTDDLKNKINKLNNLENTYATKGELGDKANKTLDNIIDAGKKVIKDLVNVSKNTVPTNDENILEIDGGNETDDKAKDYKLTVKKSKIVEIAKEEAKKFVSDSVSVSSKDGAITVETDKTGNKVNYKLILNKDKIKELAGTTKIATEYAKVDASNLDETNRDKWINKLGVTKINKYTTDNSKNGKLTTEKAVVEYVKQEIDNVNKNIGSKTIAYKANSDEQTKKTTSLTDGFNFSDGTNTKAEVSDNGVVKFNLKDKLTGITEIEQGTNGAKITLNENDITVNDKKLTGIANGNISANSKDAINGGQLKTELDKKLDVTQYDNDKKTFVTKNYITNELGNYADKKLSNITVEGKKVIKDIAKDAVEVTSDTNSGITVTQENTNNTKTTYKLSLDEDKIKQLSGTTNLAQEYAKVDGSNIKGLKDADKKVWATGIGISSIDATTTKDQLVTDKAVKDYLTTEIKKVNNNIGNKTIAYKANSDVATKKETTLTTGFDFTSTDLKITTENDGKVTFNLTDEVKNSLSGKGNDGRDGKSGTDSAGSKGLTGEDGLNGKDLTTKVNALRNGEAGTVVYTDKDGNRLVKANDGEYYKADDVEENGKAKQGRQKVKEIKATLVNPDGTTNKLTTVLRVADGSIAKDSKDTINGGQLNNLGYMLGLEVNGKNTGFKAPKIEDLKGTNTTPANILGGLNQTREQINKGLTFEANYNADGYGPSSVNKIFGETLSITASGADNGKYVGKDNSNYTGDNLATYVKQGKFYIGMKETPTFKSINIGSTGFGAHQTDKGKGDITADDKGLKLSYDNASITIEKDGDKAKISGLKDADINEKTYGKEGVVATQKEVKEVLNKINDNGTEQSKLKNGTLGTLVYTDKNGNKLMKDGDGKFYKANEDGTKEKDAKEVESKDVILSTVKPDGKTTEPITLGNVASALGLSKDKKDTNKEILNKLVNKEAKQNLEYTEAELNKVVTLRDLQFLAKQGITFAGSVGTATKFLGDTITINGSNSKDLINNNFDTKYETKNIAVKVDNKTGDIEVGLAKELKNINSIENDKTKVTLTENGTEFKTGTDGVTTKLGKDGIEITKKDETNPSVSIKAGDTTNGPSIDFATSADKKGTGSITGLKDLEDNSDGHMAANKNYVDEQVKKSNGKVAEVDKKVTNNTKLIEDLTTKVNNNTKEISDIKTKIEGLKDNKPFEYFEKSKDGVFGSDGKIYPKGTVFDKDGKAYKDVVIGSDNKVYDKDTKEIDGKHFKESDKVTKQADGKYYTENEIKDKKYDEKAKKWLDKNGKPLNSQPTEASEVTALIDTSSKVQKPVTETKLIRGKDNKFYTESDLEGAKYENGKYTKNGADVVAKNPNDVIIKAMPNSEAMSLGNIGVGRIEKGSTDAINGGQLHEELSKKLNVDGSNIDQKEFAKNASKGADISKPNDILVTDKQVSKHLTTNYYNKTEVNKMITTIDKKADIAIENSNLALGGVANAVAMANLVQVSSNSTHRHNLSAAYGYYGKSHALAIGFSGINKENNFVYKLSGSVNNQGNLALGIGAGVMLGETNDYKERKDTNLMKKELDEANKKIADYEEKQKKSDEKIKSLEQKQKVSDDRMKELEKKLELLLKNRK